MAYNSPTSTAAGLHRSWKFAAKLAWGYPFNHLKNAIEHVFAYTHIGKKVAAGTNTAILGSTASTTSNQTLTASITNPDVPRLLNITMGGNATNVLATAVQIIGTNVEGKKITDKISPTVGATGTTQGVLVFKTVDSIIFPAQGGTDVTLTVGTQNKLGLTHRLTPNFGTIIVIQDTVEDNATVPTVQAAPSSSNLDGQLVEKNWVQPATAPDGTTFLYFFYWEHKIKIQPLKDSPDFYSTTTSTSTSSTSTSSSTSSTSTSISTSSTSVSSTSSSTSSTSTSTTTLPV